MTALHLIVRTLNFLATNFLKKSCTFLFTNVEKYDIIKLSNINNIHLDRRVNRRSI